MPSRPIFIPHYGCLVKASLRRRMWRREAVVLRGLGRFATSSHLESSVEYDIDLISLKKTPKQMPGELKLAHFERFKDSLMQEPTNSTTARNAIWQEGLENKDGDKDDINTYLDFAERYFAEINVFLEFIKSSYQGKIRNFEQMTSCEMINCLYIFKNSYNNGKITDINRYNVTSYNYMLDSMMRQLSRNKNFPKLLGKELMPVVEDRKIIISLYKEGILNNINELKSLDQQFDLRSVSLDHFKAEISKMLDQSRDVLKNIENYDRTFFKVLVQVMRYRSLLSLIEKHPETKLKYLKLIINDPDAIKISARVNRMFGKLKKVEDAKISCEPEIRFLKFVFPDLGAENFYEVAEILYGKSVELKDDTITSSARHVIESFLPLYGEGIIKSEDIGWFRNQEHTDVRLFEDFKLDYQASLAHDLGVFNNLDSLRYLKSFIKDDLNNLSPNDIIVNLNALIDGFTGVEFIREHLLELKSQLTRFFVLAKWDTSVLDRLAADDRIERINAQSTNNSVQDSGINSSESDGPNGSRVALSDSEVKEISEFSGELKFVKTNYLSDLNYKDTACDNVIKVLNIAIEDSADQTKVGHVDPNRLEDLKIILITVLNKSHTSTHLLDRITSKPSGKEYIQIPEDLELHRFANELSSFRDKDLCKKYGDSSAQEINSLLDRKIEAVYNGYLNRDESAITSSNVNKFVRLSKRLTRLFNINDGVTTILDTLIHSQSIFESLEKKISFKKETKSKYVQIPDDLEIHKFSEELKILKEDELKKPFSNTTAAELNSILDKRIDEVYNGKQSSNPESRISKDNVLSFMRLSKRLTRLFAINGDNTQILDTCIQSQNVFDDLEKKLKSKETSRVESTEYVQIPEFLNIHKFTGELLLLKDEIGIDFKTLKAGEIIDFLNKKIEAVVDKSTGATTNTDFTYENFHQLLKLKNRLKELFRINGGNTEVLDVLLNSHSVFESFEKKLTEKKLNHKAYVQMPDDFRIDEYIDQLLDLKALIGTEFMNSTSDEVLNTLNVMISSEKDASSRLSLRKLFKNLKTLFKMNDNSTFVLDNVILNHECFIKFESNKAKRVLSRTNGSNSLIARNSDLINNDMEEIRQFLENSNLVGKDGIWKISEVEFKKLIDNHKGVLDPNTPNYENEIKLADQLIENNKLIEYYPNFLQQLYEIKSNDPNINLSDNDVEEIYKAIIETIEYESGNNNESKIGNNSKLREHLSSKMPIYSRLDPEPFKGGIASEKEVTYNSGDKIFSFNKNGSAADVDAEILKPKDLSNKSSGDNELKAVILDSLNSRASDIQREIQSLNELTSEDIRKQYSVTRKENKKTDETIDTQQGQMDFDKSSFKSFLRNAKEEKRLEKERKFRETKAYEWSKGMYASQRSLESNNFFDPIYTSLPQLTSKNQKDLFFPRISKEDPGNTKKEFLLLTLEGRTVSSDTNPLGEISKSEDIFGILSRFSRDDSNTFIKLLKKYQSKGWRLIGSKNNPNEQKFLILSRAIPGRGKAGFLTKMKTVFALTGAGFLCLIGIDSWLDDPKETEKSEESVADVGVDSTPADIFEMPTNISSPDSQSIPPRTNLSFIKTLFWK